MKKKMIVIMVCFLAAIMVCGTEAAAKRQVKGNAMSQYLDRQIHKCKDVTEEYLLKVAEICVDYEDYGYTEKEAIKLAKGIVKHKKCTTSVLEKLWKSRPFEIMLMLANSKKSNEEILELLAEICVDYEDYGYTEKEAVKLAKILHKKLHKVSK